MTTLCVVRAALTEERSKGASKAALRRSDETKSFCQEKSHSQKRMAFFSEIRLRRVKYSFGA